MKLDLKRQNLRQIFKGFWGPKSPPKNKGVEKRRKIEQVGEVKVERINRSSVSVLKPTTNLPCTFSREGLNTVF